MALSQVEKTKMPARALRPDTTKAKRLGFIGGKNKNAREGIETFVRLLLGHVHLRGKNKNAREGIETSSVGPPLAFQASGFLWKKQKCPRGH